MVWNELLVQKEITPYLKIYKRSSIYIWSHSYHVVCDDRYAIGKTYYGYEFVSAVNRDNIYGIQPHPEKSHNNGLKIIENFVKL